MKSWLICLGLLLFLAGAGCSGSAEKEVAVVQTPGVSTDEIRLGSSLALSGHASFLGTQTLHGALCYIQVINEAGGVHGRSIKVIAYDDGYDPPRCLENTQKLIVEDKVFGLFCYVGTPTSVKIMPLVEEARLPLVGLFTGAQILRNPFQRYIINIRASYYQETGAVVDELVESLGLKKFAVFYQYDDYGFDGLTGTQIALKKYGLTPVATGSYRRGSIEVEQALEQILPSGAEVVIMIGTYDPCAKFIRLARSRGFHPIFHCLSFVGGDELAKKLGQEGEGVIITQVVPPPTETLLLDAAAEYTKLLARYYPEDKPNYVGFEGYLNARVMVEGLRRAGPDFTRENFINAIETIENYSLGIANPLNFNAQDHQGLEKVYFTQIRGGKLELVTKPSLMERGGREN
ncbi:MAG: ABC transporter substrate-binding protein [Deltaproteobacteria bacterium]|jgi:branched-chain amino acid transport system substrate-binding protein